MPCWNPSRKGWRTGFGTFVAETRQERQGRNPRTGDVITIAASKVVRFRPGKMLKDALNK